MTHAIMAAVADAVRAFYEDVLGGREVWSTHRGHAGDSLRFLVGSELLEVRADDGDVPAPIVLVVDVPEEVAERCWDAGFLVRVQDDASGRVALSVVDPVGRRIDLSARVAPRSSRRRSPRSVPVSP